DLHPRATEHRRDLHRNIEHRLEIGGDARRLIIRIVGFDVFRRCRRDLVEIRQRDLSVRIAHCAISVAWRDAMYRSTSSEIFASVVALSSTTPPSAHSILQSPLATSGSARITSRAS